MSPFFLVRTSSVCALALLALGTAHGAEVLTLEAAQAAAVQSQPMLERQQAAVAALRERAVAAGQLPDPELNVGVNELPTNGADAWSVRRDTDTDIMVGITQTFPRGAKRRLRRLREEQASHAAEEQLHDLERMIRRDAGLVFAEVLLREREFSLIEEQVKQAGLQKQAAEIGATTGSSTQADLLAASAEEALLRDRLAETRQMLAHARIELERWVGPIAHLKTEALLTDTVVVPDLAAIQADLPNHPALRASERSRAAAEAGVDLARQGYKPDWRLEVGYGYRPEFSEMLTIRASIGLPLFRGQRQDRESSAARSELTEAAANRANLLREFQSRIALAHHDYTQFAARARALEGEALRIALAREESSESTYRAGPGSLADVLAARQARLGIELQVLELQANAYKKSIELQYFVNEGAQP